MSFLCWPAICRPTRRIDGEYMIFVNIVILVVAFAALVKGADVFVDGSVLLAKKMKVSGRIIGLTIVALGTSAPELAVSTIAAMRGSNEIALSNVTGSNIFNLLCVLGACALLSPVPSSKETLKRDMPISIIITVAVWLFGGGLLLFSKNNAMIEMVGMQLGTVGRLEGLFLIVVFLGYMFWLIKVSKDESGLKEEQANSDISIAKCGLRMLIGLALIVIGGQGVVESAKSIAYYLGLSETLVGLTIVAVGTSLPELVTSVVAAKKHETGLAVGNVVGSNIFNMMFILGITALINPVAVSFESSMDILVLFAVSVLTYIFLISKRRINKYEGISMIGIYIAQVIYAIVR